jgi:urea transport system substrate-binding protein
VLDQIRRCQADAVLVSLVGQDSVEFNRAFGRAGLSRGILRLSGAIGENELLGIGAENTDELFVSSGYFATLDTDENLAFKARYHQHFGERAPTLNTFGQSTYEGVHFLAALFNQALRSHQDWNAMGMAPLPYQSARAARYAGGISDTPIYLARADGHVFRVITRL